MHDDFVKARETAFAGGQDIPAQTVGQQGDEGFRLPAPEGVDRQERLLRIDVLPGRDQDI